MKKIEQGMSLQGFWMWVLSICIAIIICGYPRQAFAQWTTDASNNIQNTNAGSVNITTSVKVTNDATIDNKVGIGTGSTTLQSPLTIGSNQIYFTPQSASFRIESTLSGSTYDRGIILAPVQTAPASANAILLHAYPRINTGVTQTTQYGIFIDTNQGPGTITNYYPAVFMGGYVGIGTYNPQNILDVVDSKAGNSLVRFVNSNSSGSTSMRLGTAAVSTPTTYVNYELMDNQYWLGSIAADRQSGLRLRTGVNGSSESSLSDRLVISPSGNIGIGKAPTSYALDVNGAVNATSLNATSLTVNGAALTGSQWSTNGSAINYSAGNVGIGTANPANKLDIGGSLHVAGVCGNSVPNVQGAYMSWNQLSCTAGEVDFINHQGVGTGGFWFANTANGSSLSSLMFISGSGNVGIGTNSPAYKLHVATASQAADGFNIAAADNHFLRLHASAGSGAYNGIVQAGDTSIIYSNGSLGTGGFAIAPWAGATSGLRINNNGYVGIGTATPTKALDVVGDINVSGNISAKYQDVAEWVPASREMAAGTVVVLDATKSNQVIASSTAYDTRVAGVVSAKPGITLGEGGADKVLVATTGRVKVKVDATRSPIHVGDLLVTGEKEGMAMKSEPVSIGGVQIHRPGTLIGKALEPLESGTAEILVLLSLQ